MWLCNPENFLSFLSHLFFLPTKHKTGFGFIGYLRDQTWVRWERRKEEEGLPAPSCPSHTSPSSAETGPPSSSGTAPTSFAVLCFSAKVSAQLPRLQCSSAHPKRGICKQFKIQWQNVCDCCPYSFPLFFLPFAIYFFVSIFTSCLFL